jgi:hypothetical protein
MGELKDELKLLNHVSASEKEAAKLHVLKFVRKFQSEEKIVGFPWVLPPESVYLSTKGQDGESKILFENKILLAKGPLKKGVRSGEWIFYYYNGKVFSQGSYLNGLKTGNWTFFFGNGNKKSEGDFFEDEKVGLWKEWDRQGYVTERRHPGEKKNVS